MFRPSSCKARSPAARALVVILVYLSVTQYLAIVSSSLLSRPSHLASSSNRKSTLNHTSEPEPQLPATLTNSSHRASNDNSAAPADWSAAGVAAQTGTNSNDVSIESPARTQILDGTQLDEPGRSRNDMSNIEDDLVNQIIRKEKIAETGSLDQKFDPLPTQTLQTQDAGRVYEFNDVDNVTDEITVASFTLPSQPEPPLSQQDVDDSRIPYDVFPQQYLTPAGEYKSSRLVESTPSYPERNYTLSMVRPQRHSEPPLVQTARVETNKTQRETGSMAVESAQVQSSALTNKSAEVQNLANHQQEPGSSPPVGQARGGNIQARSMYSGSSPSASKTPHTRPPYATYDQFSQRSSSASSSPDSTGEQIGQRLTSRNAFPPKTGPHDENPDQSNGFATGSDNGKKLNNSSSLDVVSQIQNSLDRISSELSSEGPGRVNSKAQPEREQQRPSSISAEDKAQLQKLASVNQLVDLNPIPTDLAYAENMNLPTKVNPESDPESMMPGYYPKPLNQQLSFYPQADSPGQTRQQAFNNPQNFPNRIHLGHHNDRYGSHSSSEAQQAEFVASYMDQSALAEHAKNQDEKSGSNQNKADSGDLRYYELPNAHSDTDRKSTGEGASHAKLQATKHESPYRNKDFFKDHQERNGLANQQQHPGSLMRPSGDGIGNKHYAASFINVTAPMVPPLSATEAMESQVANQVGGKGILQQLSGFLRATQSPAVSSEHHQLGGTTDRPQQPQRGQSLYYMPPSQGQMQSIYSQPANQFSPQPPSQSEDLLQVAQNATSAEERTRLDRTDFMMASGGRSKPQIFWPTASTAQPNISSTTIHQASGFRSPMPQSGHYPSSAQNLVGPPSIWPATRLPLISNYLASSLLGSSFTPNGLDQLMRSNSTPTVSSASSLASNETTQQAVATSTRPPPTSLSVAQVSGSTTNGFITGGALNLNQISSSAAGEQPAASSSGNSQAGLNRRVFNLTRVEHISAECSNDLIRTVIIFNGTFKGIIYSSGYVRDPNCMYINGTGKTRYDFSIRLNQCGTLGRQEVHPSNGPNEVRRRDQVMWNTLSIQYNPIVEQEWDEHFRVSCEYGSDFWKTVSFSPFNVETNTGSPVVFTVDPPQCQMEILRGHGMVGPRQEVVSGPVTVGDPLTLLIHMKSEKGKS